MLGLNIGGEANEEDELSFRISRLEKLVERRGILLSNCTLR